MFSRLRRVTSGASYLPEIDGIRFLALLSVFLFHLTGDILRHSPYGYRETLSSNPLFWATQRMNFGVQMFFVLSGFVLALPFAASYLTGGRAVSLKRYFVRRLTRLEPPYIVALILFFFLRLAAGRASIPWLTEHFAASVAYLHNLIYGNPSGINFVAWSLEIEVQFYLCAPFLARLFYQIPGRAIRRIVLAGCCLVAGFPALIPSNRVSLSILGQLPYFLAGMLLAELYVQRPVLNDPPSGGKLRWDGAFLLTVPAIVFAHRSDTSLILLGPLVLCFAYYSAFHGVWVRHLLRVPLVSTIGGMCYSIYLLHNYIVAVTGTVTERFSSDLPFVARLAAQSIVIGSAVLLISGAFYLLVERPCMRPDWPARLRNRSVGLLSTPKHLADVSSL